MAPDEIDGEIDGENDGENEDEMDLINAEFESMVADLNLDQAAPTTYLDNLDAIDKRERSELYLAPREHRSFRETIIHFLATIRSWWERPDNDDSDGAVV
jgi:hypothetical protein